MRWSAQKLRWLSLGGALLLAAVVAAFFGLASYSRGKIWQRILARNGVNFVQESNSITLSKSEGGRTVFTIHAAKSVPHGKGRWTLRDAVLILYGKDGRNDRISGTQFEYDEKEGVLSAVGEVHMDLEVPGAAAKKGKAEAEPDLTFAPTDATEENPGLIHVRTSGLVYVRKLGVAATKEMAEFKYQGLTCTSRGAEFDSGSSILRLLADVRLAGTLRNAAFALTAARADLDRTADTAELQQVHIDSGVKSAGAEHALLHLRRDGTLDTGDADGDVQLLSGTERLAAPRMHADFGAGDKLQRALMSGGVRFADNRPGRAANGSAQSLDLTMTAVGEVSAAVADGGVTLVVNGNGSPGGTATREMKAQKATMSFVPVNGYGRRSAIHLLQLTGAAEVTAISPGKVRDQQPGLTRVSADDLTTTFATGNPRSPQPERMVGSGHTEMQQGGGDGQREVSTGDALDVSFAQRLGGTAAGSEVEVSSALQTGHVELRSWPAVKAGSTVQAPSIGRAQQALYQAAEGTLTLTGQGEARAEVDDGTTQLRAPRIVLHQGTGDAEASRGVAASTEGDQGGLATHALAARAVLLHGAGITEFYGTDAQPAQLWQAGSRVEAAKIVLDGQHRTMSARPEAQSGAVNAVFASARSDQAGAPAAPGGRASSPQGSAIAERRRASGIDSVEPQGSAMPEASRDAVQVRAAAMTYNDGQREATFSGGVTLRDAAGEVTGKHAAAFLQAAPGERSASRPGDASAAPATNLGGRLERLVVVGDVHLAEPGRTGTGEQITYTAATNSFVLTGTPTDPPRIHDAQQGVVSGATLVFGASDSSIVVAGTHPPGNQSKPTRVHTETDIRQH